MFEREGGHPSLKTKFIAQGESVDRGEKKMLIARNMLEKAGH
jgi:hypothetical protein